ncbi:Hypothetical predicted protein, partial [Marmota monax]
NPEAQESCRPLFSQLGCCDYNFNDNRLDSFKDLFIGDFILYSTSREYEQK